jgi:hypothetical protein
MTNETSGGACLTCYGTGEVATESGVRPCEDCYGDGKNAGRGPTMEWRLRDIERAHRGTDRESKNDVLWLAHELRRHRDALVRIVSRCQDASPSDELALEIKHLANDVLQIYEPQP